MSQSRVWVMLQKWPCHPGGAAGGGGAGRLGTHVSIEKNERNGFISGFIFLFNKKKKKKKMYEQNEILSVKMGVKFAALVCMGENPLDVVSVIMQSAGLKVQSM